MQPYQSHSKEMLTFWFPFKLWLFILVTLFLPLELIFRLPHLLHSLTYLQILFDISSIIVLFTFISFIIACVTYLFNIILISFFPKSNTIFTKVILLLSYFFILMIYLFYFYKWVEPLFINSIPYSFYPYLSTIVNIFVYILAFIFCILSKNFFLEKLILNSLSFFRVNLIIALLFSFISIGNIFINEYSNENKDIPIAKESSSQFPNIIIITFDALSAKYTSLHGYSLETTPNMETLAQKSYKFENMYASCNWTLPSVVSLLTGKHPKNNQMKHYLLSRLYGEKSKENLPYILKGLGYSTAAVVGNPLATPWKINLVGFQKTKTLIVSSKTVTDILEYLYNKGVRSGQWLLIIFEEVFPFSIINDFIKKIRQVRGEVPVKNSDNIYISENAFAESSKLIKSLKKPFFLWIHILHPHDPYFGTTETFQRAIVPFIDVFNCRYNLKDQPKVDNLSKSYCRLIRHVDYELGKFLSFLDKRGFYDNSILIVSSDHGQIFERGFWSHGGPYLYQPLVHIPLIIHLPSQIRGRKFGGNVSHVDIAPTILDLIGVKKPNWMDGHSFKRAFTDQYFDTGPKFTMNLSFLNNPSDFKSQSIAIIEGNYKLIKYIDLETYELYDLHNDPEEKNNMALEGLNGFTYLRRQLEEFINQTLSNE